ncbi:hypothetical protein CEXT_9341 [Caerostris extrusa]|uniref:Uncharacterized protein n=1 Tax=Caerostris extrusa TaxID=172846 RepID=A0AAV4V1A4_CAEEX|nr:hypothetical protein CEXT_9341 [Caerostris extrusa]
MFHGKVNLVGGQGFRDTLVALCIRREQRKAGVEEGGCAKCAQTVTHTLSLLLREPRVCSCDGVGGGCLLSSAIPLFFGSRPHPHTHLGDLSSPEIWRLIARWEKQFRKVASIWISYIEIINTKMFGS